MQTDVPSSTRTPDETESELHEMLYNAFVPTCRRLGIPHSRIMAHARAIADFQTTVARVGTPDEVRKISDFFETHGANLTTPVIVTDPDVISRRELDADTKEDFWDGVIAIEGPNPSNCRAHASALDDQKATSAEKARLRRRQAAQIERQRQQQASARSVSLTRLGVTGAA